MNNSTSYKLIETLRYAQRPNHMFYLYNIINICSVRYLIRHSLLHLRKERVQVNFMKNILNNKHPKSLDFIKMINEMTLFFFNKTTTFVFLRFSKTHFFQLQTVVYLYTSFRLKVWKHVRVMNCSISNYLKTEFRKLRNTLFQISRIVIHFAQLKYF